jgi:hypothetical protein
MLVNTNIVSIIEGKKAVCQGTETEIHLYIRSAKRSRFVKGSSPSPAVWGCAPTSSSKQAAGLQEKLCMDLKEKEREDGSWKNVVRRINFPYLDTNFSLYSYIFDVKQAYSDT